MKVVATPGLTHYLQLTVEDHADTPHVERIELQRPRGGLAPWQTKRAQRLILEQMDGRISICSLAKACNLSRAHFARMFKKSVGLPPCRWLKERRIDKAKELLASNDYGLADVATICGFADQAHFSRVFKEVTNCTPSSWRRFVGNASGIVAIMRIALEIENCPDRVTYWYIEEQIQELGSLTADALVTMGRADAVVAFLQSVREGDRD